MKLKFLIFVFVMASIMPVIAQSDWAPLGAKWHYSVNENIFSPPREGYRKIESVRDTNLLGKNCKVLHKTTFTSYGDTLDYGIDIIYSENEKVYQYIYNQFSLLYDFSLNAGDTLKIKEPFYTGISIDTSITFLIDSVTFENINGQHLKVIYQHIVSDPAWFTGNKVIEKIGDIFYLFPIYQLDCDGGFECPGYIRCYEDSSIYFIYDFNKSCDTIITYLSNEVVSDLNIYFNNNRIFINSEYTPKYIRIYDLTGKLVNSFTNIQTNNFEIDFSEYVSSIYILSVINNDKLFNLKFLKL